MNQRPIFIVGMPACGKSTFGRALARALGRHYIDLDTYIENRFHTSVREIFAVRGEAEFRRLEATMLRETAELENVVVATGGGTPCHAANMEYMNRSGTTVWLQASIERLEQRIRQNPLKRPLLAGLHGQMLHTRLKSMLTEREPHYAQAQLTFNSSMLETRAQIDATVAAFIPLIENENSTSVIKYR